MNNKLILTGVIGITACSGSVAEKVQAEPPKTPQGKNQPNIVIIYTDDMGIGDLSCFNNGWVQTPNIDKMASEGLQLTSYYSAAPISSPSRVGLTTGMFPMEWGIHTFLQTRKGNANAQQFDFLDPTAPSMARQLKAAGYHTGHFGKWHMGGGRDVKNAPQIPRYGFDEYVSTWESPDPDKKITASNWIWSNDDEVKRWERTAYFVDKALDFLSRHKGEPCFVNLWPDDMHTPWVQGQEVVDNETSWTTDPNFREVLKEYDKQIGRFMEGLKKLGLDANTIVIFTSDNGPAPSFEQIRTNSMRGQKASLYEGGIRMPFIIRWPGTIPAGKVDNENVVCSVDLFPTLCKIAGADLPKNYTLDGEDMSTALLGKGVQARTKDLMWEFGYQQFLAPKKKARSPHLAIRRGEWKLLVNSDGSQKELYNIKTDINESQNVAADHPDLVEEMSAKVLNWWQTKRKTPNNQ